MRYPIPGVDTAVNKLSPNAKWELENKEFKQFIGEGEPPSWDAIEEEIKKQIAIYNYYLYERQREVEYPELRMQLDMLYHDIKSGNLENGSWITCIDEIKNKYPKPEYPEPPHYYDI